MAATTGKKKRPAKPELPKVDGLAGALMRLSPRRIDEQAIRLMLGDRVATSKLELALEFGVPGSTLARWENEGMPIANGAELPPAPPTKSDYYPPNARNCELLRVLEIDHDCPIYETAMLLGGEILVDTLADVAKAFGVGLATVKAWASMGMPSRKPYHLISILSWRLVQDERADRINN